MKLRQDLDYPHMFWVVWEDGVESTYPYNKTWAKEHIRRIVNNEDCSDETYLVFSRY